MLYKFKSKASGDLIMLEPNGRRVLEIIGKTPGAKGIVLPEQMPAAIARLEAAIAQDEAEHAAAQNHSHHHGGDKGSVAYDGTAVGFRQRVSPFVELLKRCHLADREIVWGV
jgi:hypothetical protein